LLVSGFGTSINVDKRKLIITNRLKNERLEFLPHKITHDNIIIDGHTGNITFESLRWLSKHDIPLTILNWNGNLLSVALPEGPKSGQLRIKQYQKYLDLGTRFEIACAIIHSKVKSTLNLLQELSLYYSDIDITSIQTSFAKEYSIFLSKINLEKQSKSELFSELLMYEGRIAIIYFDNIHKITEKIAPEFNFEARVGKDTARNYNASDEINALFNYGYAILESEIKKSVNSLGLDHTIGFLHEIHPYRTPLVYDLQELFRWIVDYSIIQLLEDTPKLKNSDFILTENYNIRLRERTAKLLIEKIRLNFNSKAPYKGKNYSFSNILHENVLRLANYITDKTEKINFDVPKLGIKRNDDVTLQEKILSMTPSERKKLGINKSTLWYMKKNLKSGSKIKVYKNTFEKLRSK
jgi:CRISPR-associated protein Cas1